MTGTNSKNRQAGFTLPELIAVGVVMLIFVAAMLVLVRPANYEAERRNAERRLELAQIMQAIVAYKKTKGQLPPHITTQETAIGNTESDLPTLCSDLVPDFVGDLPYDPTAGLRLDETLACNTDGQIFETGYSARVDGGRVILSAPAAENRQTITVERRFPLFE